MQPAGCPPDREGVLLHHDFWHLLVRRLCLEVEKFERDQAEQGGYRAAYQHLSRSVLERAACLYVRVSYEESRRKNRKRFNPRRPDSILEHSLSHEKLERIYQDDDWEAFTSGHPERIEVQGLRLPYAVFENEDDVTTGGGGPLLTRLEQTLGNLWRLAPD